MGRERKDLPIAEIVAAYEAGEAPSSLAATYGVTAQTIRNRLYEAGVRLHQGGARPGPGFPIGRVAAEYGRGDPLPVLGRRYGTHPETIRRRLIRHGVQLRSPEEGLRMRFAEHGDLAALAADLGRSEQEVRRLLLLHGFIY
jgi:hypothetical protein